MKQGKHSKRIVKTRLSLNVSLHIQLCKIQGWPKRQLGFNRWTEKKHAHTVLVRRGKINWGAPRRRVLDTEKQNESREFDSPGLKSKNKVRMKRWGRNGTTLSWLSSCSIKVASHSSVHSDKEEGILIFSNNWTTRLPFHRKVGRDPSEACSTIPSSI